MFFSLPSYSIRRQSFRDILLLKQVLLFLLLSIYVYIYIYFFFSFCCMCYYLQMWCNFTASLSCEKMFIFLLMLQGYFAKLLASIKYDIKMLSLNLVQWKFTFQIIFSWVRGQPDYPFLSTALTGCLLAPDNAYLFDPALARRFWIIETWQNFKNY